MTNEKAIYFLDKRKKELLEKQDSKQGFEFIKALAEIRSLEMAIQALEQQPCEDVVSREAVLELAKKGILVSNDNYKCVVNAIKSLPPVIPQRKMGRWVLSGGYWRCSECKEKALLKFDKSKGGCKEYMPIRSDFCPNCGSYNGGGEDEVGHD